MPISASLYEATVGTMWSQYAASAQARVGTLTMDTRWPATGIYLEWRGLPSSSLLTSVPALFRLAA